MDIDALLVKAASFRCAVEARYLEAGIVPDESIIEDRSDFWERDDSILTPEAFEGSPFKQRRESLSLFASSWPPLHVWVGVLIILLYENNLQLGFLMRKDRKSLEVCLSPKAKNLLKAKQQDGFLNHAKKRPVCRGCPYGCWCEPEASEEERSQLSWKTP